MGGGSSDAYLSENDERRSIFNNAVGVDFAPVKKGTQAGTDATLEIKILSEDAAKKNEVKKNNSKNFTTNKEVEDEGKEKRTREKEKTNSRKQRSAYLLSDLVCERKCMK